MAHYHKHMAMSHELMVISHEFMLISHVHLFTNANEISLQVTLRDLPSEHAAWNIFTLAGLLKVMYVY